MTAGNWGDRWDIAYGSGSINGDRMERLYMTQPYYAVAELVLRRDRNPPYQTPSDSTGRQIGSCASCSHEMYLKGELEIPGVDVTLDVKDPKVVTRTRPRARASTAAAKGEIDAFLAAEPVGQARIDAEGERCAGSPEIAFTYYPSGFVDKSSGLEAVAFVRPGQRDHPGACRRTGR